MDSNSIERLLANLAEDYRSHYFGKYRGIVQDNQDPESMGRIKASVPAVLGEQVSPWALPCLPFAGDGVGHYTIPSVGAGVWIEFENGEPSLPIWTGCWWAKNQLPKNEQNQAATPPLKVIRTDSGMMVTMNDDSQEITVTDSDGSNILHIESQSGKITVKGAIKAIVEAPAIELVENAQHPVVFGDELLTYLTQVVNMYAAHMHPGETCLGIPCTPMTPVPPLPTPTPSLLSTKVKAG